MDYDNFTKWIREQERNQRVLIWLFILGIWFALKEYFVEGLIYDHDLGVSVVVNGALGYINQFIKGRPSQGQDLGDDADEEEMEDVGEEELFIFQRCVGLT